MPLANIFELRDRIESVNKKILEHPKMAGEPRRIAAVQSCVYMIALTQSIEAAEGYYPVEKSPLIDAAFAFCNLIDTFCTDESHTAKQEGYTHG